MIGRGGFGAVYEVERQPDGWVCAGKMLKPGASQRDRRRFEREVRLQAKLRHPNIVPIMAMNLEDDRPWFIMPRAQENLREHLERLGSGEDLLWVFEQVASGLDHAHENGVLHRDVKPENILILGEEGEPILRAALSDFGLGRFRDRDTSSLTTSNTALGTVAYAAPEQWTDAKNVDERADVFSLGKALYELLTGDFPYPDSAVRTDELSPAFSWVVGKALETNQDDRYPSVRAMVGDLRHARTSAAELLPPADVATQMAQQLVQEARFGAAALAPLARYILGNLDDNQLLTQVLPELPVPVLRGLLKYHMTPFRRILRAYDEEVSGSLPFSYCDVVADFCETLFDLTTDLQVRTLILRRLPPLGYEHNRWHVGAVFARLVSRADDPTLVMRVKDALQANPAAASWCAEYLRGRPIASAIRSAAGLGTA